VIFVGLTSNCNSEKLIRRGFRIAHRLKAAWYVTYLQDKEHLPEEAVKHLNALKELTERLGGRLEIESVKSKHSIPMLLVNKADSYKSTQMIISQSKQTLLERLFRKSVVKTVLRVARHMDVLVVAN
jgi:two-component system sensor histidine kinase KdpD